LGGSEVYVRKYENMVMLFEKQSPWASLVNSLDKFTDDFMVDRHQPPQQHRPGME
jgi:antitoxin VapB